MTYQAELDFTHTRENNPVSQKLLDNSRVRVSSQVRTVLRLLAYGNILQVKECMIKHDISHLPRRIKDIEDKIDPFLRAERTYDNKGIASYFFNELQKIAAIKFLKKLK